MTTVRHGVSQGTMLNPLLFTNIHNDFHKFIIDTSVIALDRNLNILSTNSVSAMKGAENWAANLSWFDHVS